MIEHKYKRPIRKRYIPVGLDRFDARHHIPAGAIVRVVASWGPFRGIETIGEPRIYGSCGCNSLVAV